MSDFTTWIEKNKGLWTRVYDEVIAPDFEKEWKKREISCTLHAFCLANVASGEEQHHNELKKSEYMGHSCVHG